MPFETDPNPLLKSLLADLRCEASHLRDAEMTTFWRLNHLFENEVMRRNAKVKRTGRRRKVLPLVSAPAVDLTAPHLRADALAKEILTLFTHHPESAHGMGMVLFGRLCRAIMKETKRRNEQGLPEKLRDQREATRIKARARYERGSQAG